MQSLQYIDNLIEHKPAKCLSGASTARTMNGNTAWLQTKLQQTRQTIVFAFRQLKQLLTCADAYYLKGSEETASLS